MQRELGTRNHSLGCLLTTLVACSWKSRDTKKTSDGMHMQEENTTQRSIATANIVAFWARHLGEKLFMYLPALLYLQTKSKHSRKKIRVCFGWGGVEKQHINMQFAKRDTHQQERNSCITNSSCCLLRCVLCTYMLPLSQVCPLHSSYHLEVSAVLSYTPRTSPCFPSEVKRLELVQSLE